MISRSQGCVGANRAQEADAAIIGGGQCCVRAQHDRIAIALRAGRANQTAIDQSRIAAADSKRLERSQCSNRPAEGRQAAARYRQGASGAIAVHRLREVDVSAG